MWSVQRSDGVNRARLLARRVPASLVALVILNGCLTRNNTEEDPVPFSRTYTVPVTAESRFREDLTLFVLHDGLASRLTRINSASTTRFVIPAHMIGSTGELNLLVERVGARSGTTARYSSGRVRVLQGQGLVWTLETNLQQSFLQVVPAEVLSTDTIK
jgi:hypothetical protein